MTLEDILRDIELRGESELNSLSEYYEQKITELKRKQELQVRDLEEKYQKLTDEEKRSVERTIISSAEMESLKIIRSKESELLQEALGKAMIYVKELRNSPRYSEILKKMVRVAVSTLGKNCIVIVSRQDSDLIKSLPDIKIKTADVDQYGGIIATSQDGSMEIDLTLSSIIRDIQDRIVSRISDHLGE